MTNVVEFRIATQTHFYVSGKVFPGNVTQQERVTVDMGCIIPQVVTIHCIKRNKQARH